MKLPHCVYPNPKCCGADAVTQTFRHLWYALDGRLDLYNLDQEMFGAGLVLASPGAKVDALSPYRRDKKVVWLYAPGMGNLPRFEEDCSKAYADRGGLAVVLRDGKTFDIVENSQIQGCTWTPSYRFEPDVGFYLYNGSYSALIDQTDITANRTYALPDQSGTIALASDIDHNLESQGGEATTLTGSTLESTQIDDSVAPTDIVAGTQIRLFCSFNSEGNNGTKTIRLKIGGTTRATVTVGTGTGKVTIEMLVHFAVVGASGEADFTCEVKNYVDNQLYVESGGFSIDTTSSVGTRVTAQLANSGDAVTRRNYLVEVV